MRTIQPNTPTTQEQGIIWYYRPQHGRRLLGHNGGDTGECTEAFFNPNTGVGFIMFGNCDWTDQTTAAFFKIEDKILDIYDTNANLLDERSAVNKEDSVGWERDNHLKYYMGKKVEKDKEGIDPMCWLPCGIPC